ncbi:unnamed protein product [Adineta steineri]|uniref:medium-chain acyl-CoA ligase n=1 Tax=Adineta steineri TaxID=433720 RepID=A0A814K619_9BILA|nr:unnamed protein product [Adineta steineri]
MMMMMMKETARRISIQQNINKLGNVLKLHGVINYLKQEDKINLPLINNVIQRLAIEQPKQEALWIYERNNNEYDKLTFNDIYIQASRFANVLTGKGFDLTAGKTVLAILPDFTKERIVLQLACLQSGLTFCSCNPKDLINMGISQQIQKLAVDCIVTDENSFELVKQQTYNPLRPLKKGLITKDLTSKVSAVGWNNFSRNANEAESKYTNATNIHSDMPMIRLLSNNNDVIQYSHKTFTEQVLLEALWFNMDKTSRLIWMKNQNEITSIAPWLFGSTILYKEAEDFKTMFNTLEKHPIDAFCGSIRDYEMLNNQEQGSQTQLKQLLSIAPIDPEIKARWNALTNLHIRDDYIDFTNQSLAEYLSNFDKSDKSKFFNSKTIGEKSNKTVQPSRSNSLPSCLTYSQKKITIPKVNIEKNNIDLIKKNPTIGELLGDDDLFQSRYHNQYRISRYQRKRYRQQSYSRNHSYYNRQKQQRFNRINESQQQSSNIIESISNANQFYSYPTTYNYPSLSSYCYYCYSNMASYCPCLISDCNTGLYHQEIFDESLIFQQKYPRTETYQYSDIYFHNDKRLQSHSSISRI